MSECKLPTPVSVIHTEYRFDTPRDGGDYRVVALTADGGIAVATRAADSDQAVTEFGFGLSEAAFCAGRIIAGDMGAARTPGMARMLAAALLVCMKTGIAHGCIVEGDAPADASNEPDGEALTGGGHEE